MRSGNVAFACVAFVGAAMVSVQAIGATVAADADLQAIGFKDTSYLYAGGTQTVSDKITGDYNIQAGQGDTDAQIVTLGREDNEFTGGVYVKSGTLVVPSFGFSFDPFGALGYAVPMAPIVLGRGTLHFTEDVFTDRDIALYASSDWKTGAIFVDAGKTVRTSGRIFEVNGKGNLMKRGEGTFVLATAQAGSENRIGQSGSTWPDGLWTSEGDRLGLDDYGNSPTNGRGYSAFTVANGTFVVDTPSTVTNRFGNQLWVGAAPNPDGTENRGRLEINGGVNFVDDGCIHIARNSGQGTTDAAMHSVTSTLAMTAGELTASEIQFGYYGKGVGEFDLSGGYVYITNFIGTYNDNNFGRINVRGSGRMDIGSTTDGYVYSSRWTGNANTGYEINLADRGELRLKGGFSANSYDNSVVVNLSDDARLVTERIAANGNADAPSTNGKEFIINANGGTLVLTDYTQADANYYGDYCYVGEKGFTIDISEAYRWGPRIRFDILTAPGVEQDGGLVIRGGSAAGHKEQIGARVPIRLMRPIALKGGVRIENARANLGYADFSTTVFTVADASAIGPRNFPTQVANTVHLKGLVFEGDTGILDVGIISANVANLTVVDALTLPKKYLDVEPCHWRDFSQVWTAGDYAVLKFPASVDLDPTMCRSVGNFVSSDASYTNRTRFYVEEADGWKTLHLVISGADKPFGTETIAVNEDLVLSETSVTSNDITYAVAEGKTLTFAGRYIANGRISTSGKGRVVFADGADCEFRNGFIFGTTTTNEMNGGTIRLSGKFDRASASSVIVWNGTTLKPVGGYFTQPFTTGMKSVVLGANGAFLDLSECDALVFEFGIDFKGPGDMNIVGRNPWTSFGFIRASGYSAGTQNEWTGNLVIGKGGCSTLYYGYCEHIPVLVKNGGGFGGWYWCEGKTVQFGESDTDITYCFPFQEGNSASAVGTSKPIWGKSKFTIKGKMRVAWRAQNAVDSPNGDAVVARDLYILPKNGVYRFCQAPKGGFAGVSMDQIELMPGVNDRKGARFSVDTSDKSYDYIVAEIFDKKHVDTATPASGAGTGVHTWAAAGSGDYGVVSNWNTAPDAAKSEQIAFPSTLASDIEVSGGKVHLGAVTQGAGHEVALDFDETSFADGATIDVADPSGALKIAGAIWGDGSIVKTGTSGKGRLVLDGQVKGKPTFVVNSGYLDAKPGSLGEATVKPANATVRFTDSGVCKAGFVQPTTQTTGFSVEVEDGKEVVLVGDIDNNNQFSKRGTGTLIVKGLTTKDLKLATRSKTTGTRLIPENGDAPNGEHAAVMEGRMVIDLPADRQIKVSGAAGNYNDGDFVVGFSPSLNAAGTRANDAVLDLVNGTLVTGAFSLGRRQASENTNTLAQLEERPRATANIRGGTLSAGYLMMGFCSYTYYNCYLSVMNVYDGGTVRITGYDDNLGRCVIGHDHNNTVTKDGKSDESILNVYKGGLFEHTATTTPSGPSGLISIGFYPSRASISAAKPIKGTINVLGGTVRTKVQGGIDLNHASNATNYLTNAGYGKIDGTLNLRGGLVEVGNVYRSLTNKTTATFRMDGGVYHPLQAGAALSNLTLVAVGAGGACFKIDEAYTIKTPLSHDPDLGSTVDGGLIKIGAGVLTNMVVNTFTGPIEVREGSLVMAGDSDPVAALRVDLAGTSGTIEGLVTADGAALYLDNVPAKLRGTVELPLAAIGRARFDLVYVNGQLVPGRSAFVKDGKLVTQGPGTLLILH